MRTTLPWLSWVVTVQRVVKVPLRRPLSPSGGIVKVIVLFTTCGLNPSPSEGQTPPSSTPHWPSGPPRLRARVCVGYFGPPNVKSTRQSGRHPLAAADGVGDADDDGDGLEGPYAASYAATHFII